MWIRRLVYCSLVLLAFFHLNAQQRVNPDVSGGIQILDIAPVWSGHPVGFSLLTTGDHQYAAFYAADRSMTVAERTLGQRQWSFKRLPTSVAWDTHNYITMAVDRAGFLHVMGNMHAVPLVYFRETIAGNAASLQQISAMTGRNETKMTYPGFSYAPDGALLLQYRSGGSGSGDTFINRYDERTQTWSPLTDQPLFFGGSKMNAYPIGLEKGPDGWYHQVWVWRDSPMAETNHDLSYARSRDRVHWETADGQPLTLPLTIATKGITVDASPVHGGLLNGTQAIGFDGQGRVVISYLKYDSAGNTQMYFARFEAGHWVIRQATHWSYRWDFHGGGSLGTDIRIGPLQAKNGKLTVAIDHKMYGAGVWEVDPATLMLTGNPKLEPSKLHGFEASDTESATKLFERTAADSGAPRGDGVVYTLAWQTLSENRDRPRPGGSPPPTMLTLRIQKLP